MGSRFAGGRRTIPEDDFGDEPALLTRLVNDNDVAPFNGGVLLSLVKRVTAPGPEHGLERLEGETRMSECMMERGGAVGGGGIPCCRVYRRIARGTGLFPRTGTPRRTG